MVGARGAGRRRPRPIAPAQLAADRPHHAQARGDARRRQEAVRRGAQAQLLLGAASTPSYVRQCRRAPARLSVKVCCVVGFPLGAQPPEIKALEARRAIREGAAEIDMVINIGALKSGDDDAVLQGHPRRGRGLQGRPRAVQGDPRDVPADRRARSVRGLRAVDEGRRRLREDLHRASPRAAPRPRTSP